MGQEQTTTPRSYVDFQGPFPLGINSGIEPLLLEQQQLAWGNNITVRGGYVSERPPILLRSLNFGGNAALQSVVQNGLFQGCGYYRPDFGTESLVAQIAGRLFKFTENSGVGQPWTVTEITIPGDPNSATNPICWMWQSEKWLIISDGTGALPIFYDGVSCRRSFGPSVVLGTVTAAVPSTPPAPGIGALVTLTLSPPGYTGPFNVPVLFNKEFYQPIANPGGGYNVVLTNISATVGNDVPIGSQIIVQPAKIGFVASNNSPTSGRDLSPVSPGRIITAVLTSIQGLLLTSNVSVSGATWSDGTTNTFRVLSIDPTTNTVTLRDNHNFGGDFFFVPGSPPGSDFGTVTIPNGGLVTLVANTTPNILVGITTTDFSNPTLNGNITVTLDRPYNGPSGQTVWIGTSAYTIQAVPPPAGNTTLTVINLTDASSPSAYVLPQSILSVPELPAGRMGCYGQGQNWMSGLDGRTYIFSDPDGGASGTPAYGYRDAVLKTTELTFRGGALALPTTGDTINAMIFTATLDASLGQGPLQIGTDQGMFSVTAPFDPTAQTTSASAIQTQSLIGRGPLAQESTKQVNNDTLFRYYDGLASLILARREFNTWGNTPISREVDRELPLDDETLLLFGSAVVFDNRFLVTTSPTASGQGVYHRGIIALNFDALSNLRTKAPSCYDGLWTGINTLKLAAGKVNGTIRAFSFIFNTDQNITQLYEIRKSGTEHFDNNGVDVPIQAHAELPILFNSSIKPMAELIKLRDGEIYIRDLIVGKRVDITVEYRPDFYPCWVLWQQFSVCAKDAGTNSQPGYRMRLGLGEPDPTPCEPGNNRPLRVGNFFQTRVSWTGHMQFMGIKALASAEPQPKFAQIECEDICTDDLELTLPT